MLPQKGKVHNVGMLVIFRWMSRWWLKLGSLSPVLARQPAVDIPGKESFSHTGACPGILIFFNYFVRAAKSLK